MASKCKETAPYFAPGFNFFSIFRYPLGFHYTSSGRIPSIMNEGLNAPEGQPGKNHFISFLNINDGRIRREPALRRIRYRNIKYAQWLSYFALEKIEKDSSTPAVVVASIEGPDAYKSSRPSEKFLSYVGRIRIEHPVHPSRILTHACLDREEYEKLKETYSRDTNLVGMEEFMGQDRIEVDLPIAVSRRLWRQLYQQFMYGEFVNPHISAF